MPAEPKRVPVPLRLTVDLNCEICDGSGLDRTVVADPDGESMWDIMHICDCVEATTK